MVTTTKPLMPSINGRLLALAVIGILTTGCTWPIQYVPQDSVATIPEAMRIVLKTTEQQPGDQVPRAVGINPVKLTIIKRGTWRQEVLYFEDVTNAELGSRRDYFYVRLWNNKRSPIVYVSDLADAKRFVDAIHMLSAEAKILATLPEEDRDLRIRELDQYNRGPKIELFEKRILEEID